MHCVFLLQLNLLKAQLIIIAREETVIHLQVSILTIIQEIYYLLGVQQGPRQPSCHRSVALYTIAYSSV